MLRTADFASIADKLKWLITSTRDDIQGEYGRRHPIAEELDEAAWSLADTLDEDFYKLGPEEGSKMVRPLEDVVDHLGDIMDMIERDEEVKDHWIDSVAEVRKYILMLIRAVKRDSSKMMDEFYDAVERRREASRLKGAAADSIQGFITNYLEDIVEQGEKPLEGRFSQVTTWVSNDSLGVDFVAPDRRGTEYTLLFDFSDKYIKLAGRGETLEEWSYKSPKDNIVRGFVERLL